MLGDLLKGTLAPLAGLVPVDPHPDCQHDWVESVAYKLCGTRTALAAGLPSDIQHVTLRCWECGTRCHVERIGDRSGEILSVLYSEGKL